MTMHKYIFLILLALAQASPILNNLPLIFSMQGPANYTPDVGGASVAGYKLTIGYINQAWIAAEIIGLTFNDVLVIKQNQFYTSNANDSFAGHIVTSLDCYTSLNGTLNNDGNNNNTLTSVGYSKSRNFTIDLYRSLSSNNNQDWNAAAYSYGMTQVCFYTSDINFDFTNWKGSYKACYIFEITNLVSTYRGIYLKDIILNGYLMSVYGFIQGPYLSEQVFLYQSTPLYTYTSNPAIILQLGTTDSNNGQDYNVFSVSGNETGDYFGSSVNNMTKDIVMNGFENSGLSVSYQNCDSASLNSNISGSNLKIQFSRNVSTYDNYDRTLLSTFSFCVYIYTLSSISTSLTDKYCDVVELTQVYSQMNLPVNHDKLALLGLLSVVLAIMMI